MMTIKEITTRKEYQTFDCKSIQIEPKALAVPVVTFGNAANGANVPSFRTDEFILKIMVPKVAENVQKQTGNVTENVGKVAENHNKVAEKHGKVTEKAAAFGETLTANRINILELMIENPYILRANKHFNRWAKVVFYRTLISTYIQ